MEAAVIIIGLCMGFQLSSYFGGKLKEMEKERITLVENCKAKCNPHPIDKYQIGCVCILNEEYK